LGRVAVILERATGISDILLLPLDAPVDTLGHDDAGAAVV